MVLLNLLFRYISLVENMGRKKLPKIKNMLLIKHSSLKDNGYPMIWYCLICLRYFLVECGARTHSTECKKEVKTTTTKKQSNISIIS